MSRFIRLRRSPIDHIVHTCRKMQRPIIFTINIPIFDQIEAVKYGELAIHIITIINGRGFITRINFQCTGKGVGTEGVRNPDTDIRSNQGHCWLIIVSSITLTVIFGTRYCKNEGA